MSYRGLWAKIKATEEGLGALLVRNAGGTTGVGSQLTNLARNLMQEFQKMRQHLNHDADVFFEKIFSPELR